MASAANRWNPGSGNCGPDASFNTSAPRRRPLQWFLLLVAVLNEALGLDFKRWPSDATFLYLFNEAHLQEFGQVLKSWMVSQPEPRRCRRCKPTGV
jgi:hypothetical protein